jgi:AcrR family transcriptional regulator
MTRQALLDAASSLLDSGGVDAVTLRDVGSGAGVSRTAAYRHFSDKDDLLMAVATEAWDSLAAQLNAISDDASRSPDAALRDALGALMHIGRARPHLYRLMFAQPAGNPAAAIQAASTAQEQFLAIVGRKVGLERAHPIAGLLLSAAHGITDLELSGHLAAEKWHADGKQLIDLLAEIVPAQ